jgi:hypothetical protein
MGNPEGMWGTAVVQSTRKQSMCADCQEQLLPTRPLYSCTASACRIVCPGLQGKQQQVPPRWLALAAAKVVLPFIRWCLLCVGVCAMRSAVPRRLVVAAWLALCCPAAAVAAASGGCAQRLQPQTASNRGWWWWQWRWLVARGGLLPLWFCGNQVVWVQFISCETCTERWPLYGAAPPVPPAPVLSRGAQVCHSLRCKLRCFHLSLARAGALARMLGAQACSLATGDGMVLNKWCGFEKAQGNVVCARGLTFNAIVATGRVRGGSLSSVGGLFAGPPMATQCTVLPVASCPCLRSAAPPAAQFIVVCVCVYVLGRAGGASRPCIARGHAGFRLCCSWAYRRHDHCNVLVASSMCPLLHTCCPCCGIRSRGAR